MCYAVVHDRWGNGFYFGSIYLNNCTTKSFQLSDVFNPNNTLKPVTSYMIQVSFHRQLSNGFAE